MTRWQGPAVVYRCFDAEKHLLYVGCSGQPERRLKVHSWRKPWWPDVHSTTFEHYETREEGEAAAQVQRATPPAVLPGCGTFASPVLFSECVNPC
jgi:hypothetical protein